MSDRQNIKELLSLCVRCGRCRGVCPTFEVERTETSVARGRVVLTNHLLEGLRESETAYRILNTCLLCMACEEVCTNKVPVSGIVQVSRELLRKRWGSPQWKDALSWVLSHPRVMDLLSPTAIITRLLPKKGEEPRGLLLRIPRLVDEKVFLPPVSPVPFRRSSGGVWGEGPRVLLFLGCLIDHCYPKIAQTTVELLKRLGYSCVVPKEQYCCGHPHLAMGFREDAERILLYNKRLFEREDPDFILTACASCASTLKREYDLRVPVLDLVELLERHKKELRVTLPSDVERVTWHQPCHLGRGQGIEGEALVKELFGKSFVETKNSHRCCGFGGSLSVEFSSLSTHLAKEKAEWIKESGAQMVLTDCPACIMQLQRGLLLEGVPASAAHLVTLLV